MSNDPTIDRLSAYLDDELSAEERAVLERQLSSSGSLREQLEKLRQVKDWFREYPGRKPQKDAWQGIAARVTSESVAGAPVRSERPRPRRRRHRGLAFPSVPAISRMTPAAQRFGIVALILIALGGMGRQYVLEQRADEFEYVNTLRDIQLSEYVNAAKWSATASKLRGEIGRRVSVVCPPAGEARAIWGSGVYTDDSGICTAGVHSGAITLTDGGMVTIEVRPGLDEYRGALQNGIQSRSYGDWAGSFAVVGGVWARNGQWDMDGGTISWTENAIGLRGLAGSVVRYSCPSGGEPAAVWGSDTYTDDSSICTAAVHAGIITFLDGGDVVVEAVPGQSEYDGSSQNGVHSGDWGEWPGGFVFVPAGEHGGRWDAEPRPNPNPNPRPNSMPRPNPNPTPNPSVRLSVDRDISVDTGADLRMNFGVSVHHGDIDWSTNAVEMSDWVGITTGLSCPPNGSEEPVWGTDTYMDSSSICTAAVHAGLITFEDGGRVNIEIRPGVATYSGSTRNGVSTRTHRTSDVWRGSFGFVSK